jgi:hypothetical protein
MERIPEPKTNGAEIASSDRLRPYGIDTTTAGSFQERYFMVLAGLLEKQIAVSNQILAELKVLTKALSTEPADLSDHHPRQGKKAQR